MAILVADDNPAISALLGTMLQSWGLEVAAVADGRAVLEYLQQHTPTLMVLDGHLPLLDGFELCSRIQRLRRLRGVPVVLLLDSGDEMARVQATLVGASGVISKPISGQVLRGELRRLLPDTALRLPS